MKTGTQTALSDRIYQEQYCTQQRIPGPFGERFLTYADYIASGQPLRFIEDFLREIVLPTYANTHSDASFTGRQTDHYRQEARQLIKQSVNADEDDVLLFCGSGSTAAIDKLVRLLTDEHRSAPHKPVVLVGPYEHHSNLLPWREGPFEVVAVPIDEDGLVDLAFLQDKLQLYYQKRLLMGSFSAASNVTGIIAPIDQITALLHQYGALSFWDYAAAAPYLPIDMNPGGLLNKDAVFISAHKVMGGPGTPGILVAKRKLFQRAIPTMPGGGTVHFVTKTRQRYYESIEMREEGGTPAIIESIRAGLAFKLKDSVGTNYIQERESHYINRALTRLKRHEKLLILGNTKVPRLGFLSFQIRCGGRFLHHNYVVALLNDLFGIQARGGCSCAGPYGQDLFGLSETRSLAYMDELATGNGGSKPGWVRLNFNYFIPEAEFEFLLSAVEWIASHGWKLLKYYAFDDRVAQWRVGDGAGSVNSLSGFLDHTPGQCAVDMATREAERSQYLRQADDLAQQALSHWPAMALPTYHYAQVNSALRWYTLADDVIWND